MHSLQRKIVGWLSLVMLLALAGNTQAQTGNITILKNVLDGSRKQLAKDSAVTVRDSIYFSPALISKLDTPYQVKNIVTFKINEYSESYLPMQFNATIRARIIYTMPNFSIDSVEKDFVLNYNVWNTYTSRSSFVFNNAHQVTVKVLSVSGVAANVMKALQLENEMNVRPVYKISCTDDAVKSVSFNSTPGDDSADELPVVWPATTGIDAYDLEWTYVDSTAYQNNKYGDPIDPQLLFRNNASRVTIRNNTYNIPLFYDNGGILFFRVRGVQEKIRGERLETAWSSEYSGGLGRFSFTGHQRKLNWRASVSYAEEGKRKAALEYYDGTLRNRQNVTKDNTTNSTIVQETFYDYQGRPAVEVMPAPSLNSVIRYSAKFNGGMNGLEYDRNNYDRLTDPAAYLTTSAGAMTESLGASQYYSSNNPERNTGVNQFIPSADKYPFVETAYTQDNTGRISRRGGGGYVHRLGSTHETSYYYGSPGENDLDVLFGTEAGDRSHYFKNMVQDANGQYNITYLDMYGRTVAVALAGTPDSASLDNISSNVSFPVTDTLSRANSNVIKDLVMENSQSQLVTIDGNYNFRYKLTPPVLQKKDCNNNTVCYNALYDLEIRITDDAYNQRLGGKPFDTIIRNYTGAIVSNCNAPQSFDVAFTIRLPRGNYEITKRLTVRRDAMDYYRDSVFMKKNLCKTLEQFVQEQRELLRNEQCSPDCASCLASLGTWETFRVKYVTEAGIGVPDTASFRGEAWAAYLEAVAACDALCNKVNEVTDIRAAMLLDVSAPSGQYADPEDTLNVYSIFYQKDETVLPAYKDETIIYLDESGKPDMVYDEFSNSYVTPQRLRPDQFGSKFKASWAEALLKFHPEYCKLLEFQQHAASYSWDRAFDSTDTYKDARDAGYLNPTSNGNYPFHSGSKDPLASESADMQSKLEAKLNNYNGGSGASALSLWSVATMTVKCPDNNSACISTYNTPAKAFDEGTMCIGDLDMAWRNFRQLYLSVKQGILSERIKNAACPSGIHNPTTAQLIAAGKQPNFTNAKDALSQNGLDYANNNPDAGAIADSADEALERLYADNCNAYAKSWAQQLAPCLYSQSVLDNIIIPRLVQVCKEGSDVSHPMGSSSVKPSSTNTYRSFQDVIDQYNIENGIDNQTECNGYMITNPAPYDKQVAYGDKPIYTKPDACECEKLNSLRTEYLSKGKPTDISFAFYLFRTRKIKMSDADLTQLLNTCNTTSTCTYFEKVINIPPALQCYTEEPCATCAQVEQNYRNFLAAYPGVTPLKEETDEAQQKQNQLFANYMNNKIGMNKQAWEYLVFRDSCAAHPAEPTRDEVVCAKLTAIKEEFLVVAATRVNDSIKLRSIWIAPPGSHIVNITGSTAFPVMTQFTAAVWNDGDRIIKMRDNLVFNLYGMPPKARITDATLNMGGRLPDRSIDFQWNIPAHYSSNGTAFAYLERALGPVMQGITRFGSLPATTTANRVTLPPLPVGQSTGDLNISCVGLAQALYDDYQNGMNYGVIMRLDDATEAGENNNAYVYNASYGFSYVGQTPSISVQYRTRVCDAWRELFNSRFATAGVPTTNYTVDQIDSIYLRNCGGVAGFCMGTTPPPPIDGTGDNGLRLWGKSTLIFAPVDVNVINNCSDSSFFAISKGTELFNAYRDSLIGSFNQDYINTGLLAANREVFTVSYNMSEYHYTLYYYDQAGNLVKTVPPAGVVIDRSAVWLNSVKTARAKGQKLVPAHTKATQYRYNTLEQVVEEQTPDAGITRFWYDGLGRVILVQNAQQRSLKKFKYITYDTLGRKYESGEVTTNNGVNATGSRNSEAMVQWLRSAGQTRKEVTRTYYDNAYAPLSQIVLSAKNLRGRVAYSALYANITDLAAGNYSTATFYSYDIQGNVDTLLQDYKKGAMADAGNRFKKLVYRYDLVSGLTKEVAYQPSQPDAFYHRYSYDAENRLTNVETSLDNIYWENDAYYQYYKHGTLARMVLGQQQVQGLDYAYTLQGWLKGVNASVVNPVYDMGNDGMAGSLVAKDAIGVALYYYGNRDFNIIGTAKRPFAQVDVTTGIKPLFTGNIAASSQHIPAVGESLLSIYNYDQLNRLKTTQSVRGLNTTANGWVPSPVEDFKENISYNEDGNILTYSRNGNSTFAGKPLTMDYLTYNYKQGKNRLDFVTDTVRSGNYDNDIDNQLAGNFAYDSIGNLVKDDASGISNITWTINGKIATITKADGTVISYSYDVDGNRISKTVNGIQTWYVRDASGNVTSVYTKGDNAVNAGDLTRTESHLYGTGRLGVSLSSTDVQNVAPHDNTILPGLGNGIFSKFVRGKKSFELTNQLGNVLASVSDKKRGVSTDSTTVSYFEPDIVSAQEYHPFGMAMQGRGINSSKYRYGFNGKENDNDVKGDGNQQDYGMRIYDPRLGRFLSVDPITKAYPALTPYQFASNTPIQAIDRDGLEATITKRDNVYYVRLKNVDVNFVIRKSKETFVEAALAKDTKATELTINTQMYEPVNPLVYFRYVPAWVMDKATSWHSLTSNLPIAGGAQPEDVYRAQGYNVQDGKIISGRSSKSTFYFAQSTAGATWTVAQGDPAENSYRAFGGGTPVYVDGLKYGETNIYSKDAPPNLPLIGDPGAQNKKYLLQRSNGTYPGQNAATEGKTVVGYNSKTNEWIVVTQQDDVNGQTLDALRDELIAKGYTSILAFDGSSSSTLVKDKQVYTTPARVKNNTMTTGATFTAPAPKKKK